VIYQIIAGLLLFAAGGWGLLLIAVRLAQAARGPKRNRRLGNPVTDPRSSIEQFRRIHTP
jgi:hypothetical protein